jgi:hypothetical protein
MVKPDDRRRRSSPLAGIAMAALAVVLAGCSGGSGDDAAGAGAGCPSPSSAPPAETALLPPGLSFDGIGTVTHVESANDHVTVHAVSTRPLDEVTVLIQDAVTAAGYRPAGMDNEGDEAEVFFNLGSFAAGQAELREADCEGQWDIDLELIEPDAVPSSTAVPTTTT